MKNAIIIRTDDTFENLTIDDDSFRELEQLQEAVGGYIQPLDLDKGILWVNEEGKVNGLPVNRVATVIFTKQFGPHDIIVGDVVLTGHADEEGETTSIGGDDTADIVRSLIESEVAA